ncbi:MAG: phosphate ABC transporter permease PstA [Actinobacteria bacterium]|nr:phosphate ABC transporter permease PstA [Actinomycetota bacterium]
MVKRKTLAAVAVGSGKNETDLREPINSNKHISTKKISSIMLRVLVYLGVFLTVAAMLFIVVYILIKGVPYITPSLFEFTYTSDNVSLMPALINTVLMTAVALVVSTIIGVFAAIFLVEYTGRGNKFVSVVSLAAETLSGIPSIVYGLFGMLFFVLYLHWGISLLSGALTLAIMTLPLIMRTTQEALIAVPDAYREASFGLGAGPLRTVFKVVLPSAIPGILAGIILAIGRIVGESAALIYTAGTIAKVPDTALDSTRTLAVHMYVLASEGLHINETYATAVILLILVVLINAASSAVAKRMTKGKFK